jgi:16S rRNA (cytidine1402-2'-O)-methyltransferase
VIRHPATIGVVAGTLWLVGTPIGNLGDLSPRARETLASVDVIAAEDTRRTGRLLKGFDIHKPLVSFFEGNERERTESLLARLRTGASVAVVTDGGMPAISDPGFRLVRACADAGIEIRVVPGPSAALAALVVSGLPTDRFSFEGFLPRKPGDRMRRLEALRDDPRTLVLFESPRRVQALLRDVLAALGDRRVALARELTKLHEEVHRGRASEVLSRLGDEGLKGEVVVVIQGASAAETADLRTCVEEARVLVAGGMRKRDAAHAVAARHGLAANTIYRTMLASTPADEH